MYKTYKFRLYPDNKQKENLNYIFRYVRYVHNHYLAYMIRNGYKTSQDNIKDYMNNLKLKKPMLKYADDTIIRKLLFKLDDSYKLMLKDYTYKVSFKSKYKHSSYIIDNYEINGYTNIVLDLNKRMIKFPKLGYIKIRGYRNIHKIDGKLKNVTISIEGNTRYYVSVLYEIKDVATIKRPCSIVGIDLGIKNLLTLSNGISYKNNKYLLVYKKKIRRFQKELSRKIKGSNNYYKCRVKLCRLYSKLANSRKYYLHEITKALTDKYDILILEDLSSEELLISNKKHLSKYISDASFGEIIRQITYKSVLKGKYFYQINRFYPSSQICNKCGFCDEDYKNLDKREYVCKNCGETIDRDLNASINIMSEGLKMFLKTI
mgnify:CR=1 FL=1